MKSNKQSKSMAATLAKDYTPEVRTALDAVKSAAVAFKTYDARGREVILPKCVEATRAALAVGIIGGTAKDGPAWRESNAAFGARFGLSSGSEVTFWVRGAKFLDAGGTVGDELWLRLMTAQGAGTKRYLAKRTEVGKVIDDGGSLAEIAAVCDAVEKAAPGKGKGKRKARPGAEESAEQGVPTSDDPVADALLCILGLEAAWKRIPVKDREGNAAVAKRLNEVTAREAANRKPRTRKPRTIEAPALAEAI